eukprot:CAMPEP_0196576208 /NCGR_PEP_ID=MMETSP1081-20130531/5528_1 /TAXON_ID=36882 /ORGANISM="Pyramimonas amylifera, Strain CCMP720" /LENGTH=532 /DNA_ID=CAMNT_0041894757 /DNA_START=236 /DNA_END=1834 /DNA_ORIENTATION=+
MVEPVYAVVDVEAGLQRIDFYDGMNKFFYDAKGALEQSFEILPVVDKLECFAHPTMGYRKLLPDVSQFVHVPGGENINDVKCEVWKLDQKTLNLTSGMIGTYTLYVDATTHLPVRFHFIGHSPLFGSAHSDEYQVDYSAWKLDVIDTTAFDLPKPFTVPKCIENSARPTMTVRPWRDPTLDLTSIFPENHHQRVKDFDEYKIQYGKQYSDVMEHNGRHSLFHMNLKFIHSENRKGLSYWLGVNHLVDWTVEELRMLSSGLLDSGDSLDDANYTHVPSIPEDQLPKEVNWTKQGAVTKVKDQGSCGSCWSFGTVAAIEGQLFRKTGNLVRLSEQELMDCSWHFGNKACNGGYDKRSYKYLIQKTGGTLSTDESYGGYLNAAGWCHWEKAEAGAKINGFVNVPTGDMHAFNDALVNIGPLSVGIDATSTSMYYYAGGLYDDPKCGISLDHIVTAVGYITVNDQKYTIIKNSWSTHWGMNGYILVSQKDDVCGLALAPTYPLMADNQPVHDTEEASTLQVLGSTASFRTKIKTVA